MLYIYLVLYYNARNVKFLISLSNIFTRYIVSGNHYSIVLLTIKWKNRRVVGRLPTGVYQL